MKKLVLITVFSLFNLTYLFGQIELTWESIDIINETTISVKVFVQNLGSRTPLWNKYGNTYYDETRELNFHVEYDYTPTGEHITSPPSSITIKTIFGGSLSMDTPVYYFEPTGTESGERWEIVFYQIPKVSGNVIVKILGEKRLVGDMALAEITRKKRRNKFLLEKDSKVFDYKEFHPHDFNTILQKIENSLQEFSQNNEYENITGIVKYSIKKDGSLKFVSDLNNKDLNNYLSINNGNYKLQKTEMYGYSVASEASFVISMAKGASNIKLDKYGNITKIKPVIANEIILSEIKTNINQKGLYKVKFNYISVNNKELYGSAMTIKQVPITRYLFWGIPALIGLIIVLSGGV